MSPKRQRPTVAEMGLRDALYKLIESAEREPDCTCEACRRLRGVAESIGVKSGTHAPLPRPEVKPLPRNPGRRP